MWVKKFAELALSGTVFEIQAFLCFAIFCEKFENSTWPPFLVGQIFFLTIGLATQQSYPTYQNFCQNRSSTVSEIQAFLCFAFLKKFENSKWLPFLASEIFVEIWKG